MNLIPLQNGNQFLNIWLKLGRKRQYGRRYPLRHSKPLFSTDTLPLSYRDPLVLAIDLGFNFQNPVRIDIHHICFFITGTGDGIVAVNMNVAVEQIAGVEIAHKGQKETKACVRARSVSLWMPQGGE